MDTLDAIRGRRSIRDFKDEPIPQEVLEEIVEAARWAPYGTRQDRRTLIVLTGEEKDEFIQFLAQRLEQLLPTMENGAPRHILAYAQSLMPILRDAAALVVVYAALSPEGPELSLTSAATAVQSLMLAAHARGIGSCYTTGAIYLADDIAEHLHMRGHQLVALVPLGYPEDGAQTRAEFPRVIWGLPQPGTDDQPPQPAGMRVTGMGRVPGDTEQTILLVDDSPGAAESISDILSDAGYKVVHCAEPGEAVSVFRQVQPDLTIIDAILPQVSGYEICRSIQEVADGPCPVIVTTTAYDEADELEALRAGADDVLTKPVQAHELLARVHALLRMRELYQHLDERAGELAEANDKLRELDQLKDDLTHMVIHDLRTPLTNVITGLQTLEQLEYEEELTRELVPMAIEGAEHLAEMINNLLDISKMESGQMQLHREHVLVEEVVDEALGRVGRLAEEEELELVTDIQSGLEVYADRDLLVRVAVNLLGNAIKFTPAGGSITVGAERRDDEVIVVGVKDTGDGIPEEELDRIFDKFHMVERAEAPKRKGTGLGLSFVKLAVEAHGGRVWVESKVGEGSAFFFALPVAD